MRTLTLKVADRLEEYTDKEIYAHIEQALEIAMEDYDEAQRHASESEDVKKFNKQRDDWYELQQGLTHKSENTLGIAGTLARMKVYDLDMTKNVACELLTAHSCTFKVEPLPDGEYAITVKDEGILEQVRWVLFADEKDKYIIEKLG